MIIEITSPNYSPLLDLITQMTPAMQQMTIINSPSSAANAIMTGRKKPLHGVAVVVTGIGVVIGGAAVVSLLHPAHGCPGEHKEPTPICLEFPSYMCTLLLFRLRPFFDV